MQGMRALFHLVVLMSFLFMQVATSYGQDDILQSKSQAILVNDEADLFSSYAKQDLENMLVAYDDSTSTQIAVITVKSLNGYAPGDYAARLGEQWGVGRSGKDNGVVILIKPRIGNERGQVFIATGYGVEHILTDARVGRIIDNYMLPYLPNDYYGATKAAVGVIIEMLSGEFQADSMDDDFDVSTLLIAAIFLAIIIYSVTKSSKNNGGNNQPNDKGSGGRRPTYIPPIFGSGRGGGRGNSGGGFGGFGGGRFGGGGAGRGF